MKKELDYIKGNIQLLNARKNLRKKDDFGYEAICKLADLGGFVEPLLEKLSEEEIQAITNLIETAAEVDRQYNNGKKTMEQRNQELKILNNLIDQTSYYYKINYGYKNDNKINDDVAQSIQINEIKEYLTECQKLANLNIDDEIFKNDVIFEYQTLISYINILDNIVLNNKDNSDVIKQVAIIIDKFIKVLNNSDSLYALTNNSYNLKVQISELNDQLNNGMKM